VIGFLCGLALGSFGATLAMALLAVSREGRHEAELQELLQLRIRAFCRGGLYLDLSVEQMRAAVPAGHNGPFDIELEVPPGFAGNLV
jgi:hypothetical protein